MPITICQRCHSPNDYNATVCQNCGARLCPNCHLVIESPHASICPKCGKKDPTFKPGKYSGSTYVPSGISPSSGPSATYCSHCGSKIDPDAKKCPYCGRLGSLVTQSSQQGYDLMRPSTDEGQYRYAPPAPETVTQTQKVCQKCGMPFPPGSSQCPKHGKYGGGSRISESTIKLEGANLWAKIEEKRAASASGEQTYRRAPSEEKYDRMHAAPEASPEVYPPEAPAQRICQICGGEVPDRSKVCPHCGNNRLPSQKGKPIIRAEDYYKAHSTAEQPYDYYPPVADPYYGQPAAQPYSQPPYGQSPYDQPPYGQPPYGQPDIQPYEAMYPVGPSPIVEEIGQYRKVKREKPPREARPGQRKSPLPILLAMIALAGVIIIAAVLILDQLNTPPAVVPPASLNPQTTTPSTADMVTISDIEFGDITGNSAVVTWKTDQSSNSIVVYCLDGGDQCETAKDDTLVTDHSVTISGLEQGRSYHITVKSRMGDSVDSPEASKDAPDILRTTDAPDTIPPQITSVAHTNIISVSSTYASAEITWKTDEPATSQVSYGTSHTYGSLQPAQTDTTLEKFHDIVLENLPVNSTIYYKVISRDAGGNETSSPEKSFVTPPPSGSAIGNAAPDFTLQCADGSTVTLSSLRGSKVIVNFWHLNCVPCINEMPYLQIVHEDNPDIPMLCIHGTTLGPLNSYAVGAEVSNKGYTFTVPLDPTGQVCSLYNISSIPKTFFLDSEGIIKQIQEVSFSDAGQIEDKLNAY